MAREQKAARAAEQEAPEASPPPAPSVELVLMSKGDETAEVHPTCVTAHVRAGWAVVAGTAEG